MTSVQIDKMARQVLSEWKSQNIVQLKVPEEKIHKEIVAVIQKNIEDEKSIEREANKLLDDLERKGQKFERHKMFLMVKKKLAEEKKFVL